MEIAAKVPVYDRLERFKSFDPIVVSASRDRLSRTDGITLTIGGQDYFVMADDLMAAIKAVTT